MHLGRFLGTRDDLVFVWVQRKKGALRQPLLGMPARNGLIATAQATIEVYASSDGRVAFVPRRQSAEKNCSEPAAGRIERFAAPLTYRLQCRS